MESKRLTVILAMILVSGIMAGCKATAPVKAEKPESKLETLAKCLSEKGAKLYGTYWCSWCKRQKEIFKEAAQYLPYIECSVGETRETTPQCEEAGIARYPTWEIEGKNDPGFKKPEKLAELTGCSF